MPSTPVVEYVQHDFNGIPLVNVVPESRANDTGITNAGRLWYRSDLGRLRFRDGTTVREFAISGLIADADIAGGAAIAQSKLNLAIADAQVAAGAAIAQSKLALSITNNEISATAAIAKSKLAALAIVDADVAAGAAISKSKLAALNIADADVAAGAAISESKLNLASDAAVGTASRRTLGLGALQAMPGNTRIDQIAVPTAAVSHNGQRLTNLGAPNAGSTDAATAAYVDNAVASARTGIQGVKDPVRVASPVNVNLAAPGATIDGAAMVANDRFLAPNQTTGTQNGIYVWNGSGVAATRATDNDAAGEIVDGTMVAIAEGTDAGKTYIQQATPAGAIGAWAQQWTVFTTAGTAYSAGNGLSLAGTVFSLSAPVSLANGGVGVDASSAAGKLTARGNLGTGRAGVTLAVGTLTAGNEATIPHGLATDRLILQAERVSDGAVVNIGLRKDATNVYVTADIGVTAGTLQVLALPIVA